LGISALSSSGVYARVDGSSLNDSQLSGGLNEGIG
jgi:hypothetical protein